MTADFNRPLGGMVAIALLGMPACTYAPAPKAEFGEGPPAKFLVGDTKGTDTAALSDASSKTDAGILDGPRPDSGAAVDSVKPETEDATAETTEDAIDLADLPPEDADPPDSAEEDAELEAGPVDVTPPDSTAADTTKSVGFAEVWTKVLTKYGCSASFCHGKDAPQPIFPNQGIAYAVLLQESGTAGDCSGVPLVTQGKPETSLLWLKIAPDTPSCGQKMPITAENNGLDVTSAALVAAWIKGGAKP